MRKLTKLVGQLLYRDGPMIIISTLFAVIFLQNVEVLNS